MIIHTHWIWVTLRELQRFSKAKVSVVFTVHVHTLDER